MRPEPAITGGSGLCAFHGGIEPSRMELISPVWQRRSGRQKGRQDYGASVGHTFADGIKEWQGNQSVLVCIFNTGMNFTDAKMDEIIPWLPDS